LTICNLLKNKKNEVKMNSRITIELDLDNNNESYIKVKSAFSDDLRDKILRNFIEAFGHQNGWMRFEYTGTDELDNKYYRISNIRKYDLSSQADLMKAMSREYESQTPKQEITYNREGMPS